MTDAKRKQIEKELRKLDREWLKSLKKLVKQIEARLEKRDE